MNFDVFYKLKGKLFLVFGTLVAVSVIVTSTTVFSNDEGHFNKQLGDSLAVIAHFVATVVTPERLETVDSCEHEYYKELKRILTNVREKANLPWVAVYRKKGNYFINIADGSKMGNEWCYGYPIFDIPPELNKAWEGEFTLSEVYEDAWGSWRSAFCPIKLPDGKVVGVIDTSKNVSLLVQMRNQAIFRTTIIILIAVLVGMLVSVLFSNVITSSLNKLMEGIQVIGAGDLTFRFPSISRDEIGAVARKFNEMLKGLQEKARMSRFVSESVWDVVKDEIGSIEFGGEERKASVLFSDIRSFTTITEEKSPRDIVLMLNDFLNTMTGIIKRHDGVVDKFIGDCIMAVFYPGKQGDDETRAVLAGVEMMEELKSFNHRREQKGMFTINIGVGVNSGRVIAGIIGAEQGRLDYTVIGDAVNTAARLEGMSREGKHTKVIISEPTYKAVEKIFLAEKLGVQKVKGKLQEVQMFEIVSFRNVEELLNDLESPQEATRIKAVHYLGLSGRGEMICPLLKYLQDPSSRVRIVAGKALKNFSRSSQEIVPTLKEAISAERDSFVLATFILTLGNLAKNQDLLVLEPFLTHDDNRVRANTIEAIGNIDNKENLKEFLRPKLQDQNNRTRANAAILLFQNGDQEAQKTLFSMCADASSALMRASGAYGIGELAQHIRLKKIHPMVAQLQKNTLDAETARKCLESLLDDKDPMVFQNVVLALGRVGNPASLPALISRLGKMGPNEVAYQSILTAIMETARQQQ